MFVEPLEPRTMLAATPVSWLAANLDQYSKAYDVYTDADAAGNHFDVRGSMGSAPAMNEASTTQPHSGLTCIQASFQASGDNWGGWFMLNGVLSGSQLAPQPNWGDQPNAGVNLSGATQLTFWWRGQIGGERVRFLALGVGRGSQPYPDSADEVTTGFVTLSTQWQRFSIDLSDSDLRYVLGGFGWVSSAAETGGQNINFYIDDIQYNKPRLTSPHFLLSYTGKSATDTFDRSMKNVAYTYDNAAALCAFVASGDKTHAAAIASALVYAQGHDRTFTDGRLRNAYQAGDLAEPAGWNPNGKSGTARLPGWTDDSGQWLEDPAQTGTYTGNVAWAILSLLAYYQKWGGSSYLNTAVSLGNWITTHTRDTRGAGGYLAGYLGPDQNPTRLMYKSAEHNIDVYAAFSQLGRYTKDSRWTGRAEVAQVRPGDVGCAGGQVLRRDHG